MYNAELVFKTGVSGPKATYTADLLRTWVASAELAGEVVISVQEITVAAGGANVAISGSPTCPWGPDGPYRTEFARDLAGWARELRPPEPPNPANYLKYNQAEPKIRATQAEIRSGTIVVQQVAGVS